MKEHGAEQEDAHRDEDGGGDDEQEEERVRVGERRDEVFDFGEVGEGSDVEGEVHELEQEEEGLDGAGGCFAGARERRRGTNWRPVRMPAWVRARAVGRVRLPRPGR